MAVIPAAQLGASRFVSFDPDQGVLAAEAPDGTVQNLLAADPATGGVLHRSYGPGGPHVFQDGAGNPVATLSAAWIAAEGEVMALGNRNVREWANLLHRPDVFPPSAHTHAFAEITGKPTTLAGYGITDALGASHTHALTDAAITGVLPVSKGGTGSGELGDQGTVLVSTGNGLAYGRITDASVSAGAGIAWSKVSKAGAVAADVGALSQAAADARYFPMTGGVLNGNLVATSAGQGDIIRLVTQVPYYGSNIRFEDGEAGTTWRVGINLVYEKTGVFHVGHVDTGHVALVASPNGWVAINPLTHTPAEALDVNGNVLVRGSVRFADGSLQGAAAYATAASDARYVLADALASGAVELPAEAIAFPTSNGVVAVGVGGSVEAIHNGGAGTVLLGGTAAGGSTGLAFGKVSDAHVTTLSWGKIAHPTTRDDYGITDVPSFTDLTIGGRAMLTAGNIMRPTLPGGGVLIAGTGGPDSLGAPVAAEWTASEPGKVLVGGVGAPFFTELYDTHVAADAAIAWSKIDRTGALLSDLGGGLAGPEALPSENGVWQIDVLRINGEVTIPSLYTFGLSISGGRIIHSSDDIPRLDAPNTWLDENVFEGGNTATPVTVRASGDTGFRLQVDSWGTHRWGVGTGASDTALYRSGAATLSMWGTLLVGAPNVASNGTGGTKPNTAAALEVLSTTKGFLPPRMTTTQRDAIATPPDGLIVYNSTTGKLNLREAGAWKSLTSA